MRIYGAGMLYAFAFAVVICASVVLAVQYEGCSAVLRIHISVFKLCVASCINEEI